MPSDELEWDTTETDHSHYGPHMPISSGEQVVCAHCGAVAVDADPTEYP